VVLEDAGFGSRSPTTLCRGGRGQLSLLMRAPGARGEAVGNRLGRRLKPEVRSARLG
jgi:hypothetical protein